MTLWDVYKRRKDPLSGHRLSKRTLFTNNKYDSDVVRGALPEISKNFL